MEIFKINISSALVIQDEDMDVVASAWPAMQELRFERANREPAISLNGLSTISSHCLALRVMEVAIRIDNLPFNDQKGILRIPKLAITSSCYDFGLACYFMRWFPHARIVCRNEYRWNEA